MALRYTTVQGFLKFMGLNDRIMRFNPGETPTREKVATSPVTAGDYYLDQMGVNEDTLQLFAGSTQLTLDTDYTFDSDTSKVTVTSAGETALAGEDLDGEYEFSVLGDDLNYNEIIRLLTQAEDRLLTEVGTVFANQSDTNPNYLQIVDEKHIGGGNRYLHYQSKYYPLIKLQTTVDGDYTTGATTITLADASGFPNAATIYIGGNKVAYTGKSGNDLTIPSDTPSIDDGADVRSEVIEISTAFSGTEPNFVVLTVDTSYDVDHRTGEVQLQERYYYDGETYSTDGATPSYGVKNRFRMSYMTAWKEPEKEAVIPEEIEEVVYMMAGRQVVQRTILKANSGQRDNFNITNIGFSQLDIERILKRYRSIPSSRN